MNTKELSPICRQVRRDIITMTPTPAVVTPAARCPLWN